MRKIFYGLSLLFAVTTRVSAQIDETTTVVRHYYYYYPAQNIYYDEVAGDYWYYDASTAKWVEVTTLPSAYIVKDKDNRYKIYYNGENVWMDNKKHRIRYKVKNDGRIKVKPKNEP